ncbi:MAG: oligopeptide transporter, OPT family [Candidatus Kapabacteria bacterium]|nr:oligopeptide transporter, OPT family [Candidatus Kapabacteria bacterium]
MSEAKKFVPFVSNESTMAEFTLRALLIGLVMSVILGAANAYLGLRAGMTIAATYPAAVIGMALLKVLKGSILEENFARTVGSIGESVAAGAIFTLPAFFISGLWKDDFSSSGHYITASLILIVGGILGIMFVALLRRVMVEDAELPFPESVAAAEIHKTGRTGGTGSVYLFSAMAAGAFIKLLAEFKFFAESWRDFLYFSKQTITATKFSGQGGLLLSSPEISPAYMGVGYIIGPKLGALNFSGGLIAWGLLVPIILYFLGPNLDISGMANGFMQSNPGLSMQDAYNKAWISTAVSIWKYIVKPIAIGGMLMGAGFTLFKMRKSLIAGIGRSVGDVKKAASGSAVVTDRTDKDIKFSWIMIGIAGAAIATFCITKFMFHTDFVPALAAATALIVLAFFFAAISGYLVGIMGSSNNPISGLTLTTLVVTALIMVLLGVDKLHGGVAAVLGVAAIVCVAAAVAGEMLQDLKAGHILGGTPWKMQVGDLIGVVLSGAVMFLVLNFLNQADIAEGIQKGYVGGFGSEKLSAPQAGLMSMLSIGIVDGQMAWPLIIVGMLMGLGFILMQVRSPMLVSVGMYLPLGTTFAIFLGGLVKGVVDMICAKRGYNESQRARIENIGVLLAAGFIAGEALTGLGIAPFKIAEIKFLEIFANPPFAISLVILTIIALVMIFIPLKKAGSPDEPATPMNM